ncbi:MAG: hypothetical protein HYZ49_13345 [Chloroflexi bacterium]|nr:hypothetical protein [Chloroflexota bacterium]
MAEPNHPLNQWRIDPVTGLPLPDPFPEYIHCPHCGESEVEVFCYQTSVKCHNCGKEIPHTRPPGCGAYPFCKRGEPSKDEKPPQEGG